MTLLRGLGARGALALDDVQTPVSVFGPAMVSASATRARTLLWLRALEHWQQARRSPAPILADALITAAGALIVVGSWGVAAISAGVFMASGLTFGLFKRRNSLQTQGILWYLGPLALTLAAEVVVLLTVVPWTTTNEALQTVPLVGAALISIRVALWFILGFARRKGLGLRPTLVVAPPDQIERFAHRLRTYPEAGLAFEAAYAPTLDKMGGPEVASILVEELLSNHAFDHVICASEGEDPAVFRNFVRFGAGLVDCSLAIPMSGLAPHQTAAHLGDLGLITVRDQPAWGTLAAKRVFDVLVSALGLVVLSPILVGTVLAIRLGDKGPAIFRQSRVGKDGKLFTLYKFRSMVLDAEAQRQDLLGQNVGQGLLFKVEADPRVTRVGALIRRFSIDELPQLWNVLLGTMSLVGPRPLPVSPEEFDTGAQARHRVRPGITGLWQVHGCNAIPYPDMIDLDLNYICTQSLALDLQLLFRTIPVLLIRRSAY